MAIGSTETAGERQRRRERRRHAGEREVERARDLQRPPAVLHEAPPGTASSVQITDSSSSVRVSDQKSAGGGSERRRPLPERR